MYHDVYEDIFHTDTMFGSLLAPHRQLHTGSNKAMSFFFSMGLLPDTYNCGLRMPRQWRERFPRHGLANLTCITARARHTCRDACRDR